MLETKMIRFHDRWMDLAAMLFLLAVVVTVLHEPLLSSERTLAGNDFGQVFNWEVFNRAALGRGELPLWNPHVFSGTPGLADIQTRFFYPPDAILRAAPLTVAFNIGFVFHLWLAAAGTYTLCRQIGTGRWPAVLAALGFALGGAFTPRLYPVHLVLIWSIAWLPLIMALCLRSIASRSRLPLLVLPVVLAIQILAGYMQGSIYVVTAVVALYTYQAVLRWRTGTKRAPWHLLSQLGLILFVSAGLAAVQLISTARLVGEAGRARGVSYEAAARDSLSWAHLTTLVFPSALAGRTTEFREDVPGGMWEKSGYVGLVLFIVAPLSLMSRSRRSDALFWATLALIALAFALGKNLPVYEMHHTLLPGLRNPGRLLPFWSLGIAVMGALGLDRLRQHLDRAGSRVVTIWLAAVMAAALAAGILTCLRGPSGPSGPMLLGTSGWLLILVGAAFAVTLLSLASWRWALVPPILTAVALLDLVPFAHQFVVMGRPPRHEDLGVALYRLQPARVLSLCDDEVAGNDMIHLGVGGIDGYNGIFLSDYAQLAFLAKGQAVPVSYTQFPSIGSDGVPDRMDLVNMLNTSHLLSCEPLDAAQLEQVSRIQRLRIYANRNALPRALWICNVRRAASQGEALELIADPRIDLRRTAVVLDPTVAADSGRVQNGCSENATISIHDVDRPDGLVTVSTESSTPGFLFLSEPRYPERKVTVDGHEIAALRANLAFSAIPLESGMHTVELRYVPITLYAGALVSLLTAIIWTAASIRVRSIRGRVAASR